MGMSNEHHWIHTPPQLPAETSAGRRGGRGLLVVISSVVLGFGAGVVGGMVSSGGTTGSNNAPVVTAAKVDQSKVGNTSVAKAAAVITPAPNPNCPLSPAPQTNTSPTSSTAAP